MLYEWIGVNWDNPFGRKKQTVNDIEDETKKDETLKNGKKESKSNNNNSKVKQPKHKKEQIKKISSNNENDVIEQ